MMFKKGIFVISIDVELAWGTFDHGGHLKYKDAYAQYRFIVTRLLGLFQKYQIPATWAIVGHLFLDSCHKENGILHPEIVRPRHRWFREDWFSFDPGTDIRRDEFWYGSDIVKMLKEAIPQQEIACHSFCHPVFADKGYSKEAAEADIAKCVELAKKEGIDLVSFAFPRNAPGHLGVLRKFGFRVFRGEGDVFCRIRPNILRKAYLLFSDMAGLKPPLVSPEIIFKNGLVEIPASMLFRFAYGKSRFIPQGMRFKKAKKGLDAAVKEKKIFHLWFHPINFAWDTEQLFEEFRRVLEYAQRIEKEGKIDILPMGEVANLFLASSSQDEKYNPEAVVLHDERSSQFADDYADRLGSYYDNAFKYGRKKIESAFLGFLNDFDNGVRLLDLGAGPGYHLNLAHSRKIKCCGVDLSENMLRQAKRVYPYLNLQRADARNLPFAGASFDAVVSIETLRYFSDGEALLKEIFRVTKNGGSVFISAAPLFSLNAYGIFNTLCRFLHLGTLVSCFQSFETVSSLRQRLKGAGFADIEIRGYFFGPYFLLDKLFPRLSSFMMKRLERADDIISQHSCLSNFSNHLVAVARKP